MKIRLLLALCPLLIASTPLIGEPSAEVKITDSKPIQTIATQQWIRSELYFAIGRQHDSALNMKSSEKAWETFLEKNVTPRFPKGLTVVEAYGQWKGEEDSEVQQERTKLLIIMHEATAENTAAIESIRKEWKDAHKDESVLLVSSKVDVSF